MQFRYADIVLRLMPLASSEVFRFLKICGLYLGGFLFIFFLSHFLGFTNIFPSAENLLQWDSGFYYSISQHGYEYYWYRGSNSGFFPFFPYVWRWLHLNVWTVCIFNFVIYVTGVYLLFKRFKFSVSQTLCYMSIPSAIFFFLPFTEAFFFLFSSMLLIGLQKDSNIMIVVALFLCSVTRGTAMFFIPAIICVQLFSSRIISIKKAVINTCLYIFSTLLGLFVVVLVQYYQTYEWFAFAKVQTKFYHHFLAWPGFPLISFGDNKLLWLDGMALFFGFLAVVLCVIFAIRFLMRKDDGIFQHKAFWFSATYLAMVVFYSVFYTDSNREGLTPINSINRYVFASAYFFVFVKEGLNLFKMKGYQYFFYFIVGFLTWLALGFGQPVRFIETRFESEHRATIFFCMMAAYTFAFLHLKKAPERYYIAGSLFVLNLILSVYILSLYLRGEWVA